MTSEPSPTKRVFHVTCPRCHEVQSDNVRCARCGTSLGTKEQRKARLSHVERARRAAERDAVAIARFPGLGTNARPGTIPGTRQFFADVSNQRRRRYILVLAVFVIGLVLLYGH